MSSTDARINQERGLSSRAASMQIARESCGFDESSLHTAALISQRVRAHLLAIEIKRRARRNEVPLACIISQNDVWASAAGREEGSCRTPRAYYEDVIHRRRCALAYCMRYALIPRANLVRAHFFVPPDTYEARSHNSESIRERVIRFVSILNDERRLSRPSTRINPPPSLPALPAICQAPPTVVVVVM